MSGVRLGWEIDREMHAAVDVDGHGLTWGVRFAGMGGWTPY